MRMLTLVARGGDRVAGRRRAKRGCCGDRPQLAGRFVWGFVEPHRLDAGLAAREARGQAQAHAIGHVDPTSRPDRRPGFKAAILSDGSSDRTLMPEWWRESPSNSLTELAFTSGRRAEARAPARVRRAAVGPSRDAGRRDPGLSDRTSASSPAASYGSTPRRPVRIPGASRRARCKPGPEQRGIAEVDGQPAGSTSLVGRGRTRRPAEQPQGRQDDDRGPGSSRPRPR